MKVSDNCFATALFSICVLCITFASCQKANEQPIISKSYYSVNKFVMGADLSYVNQLEYNGAIYKDSGVAKDPFLIFKQHGCNLIRVRLWNNPIWQKQFTNGKMYSDIADVAKTISRAKALGLAVNLDLHYSDTWADPQHQTIPAAWANKGLNVLKDSVYNYTISVLQYLQDKNLVPEMIQIGNETNNGILWDTGRVVNNNFTAFGILLNSGIKAVRDFSKTSVIQPKIILHVAQINSADWFANGVIDMGGVTDFDILGISHYTKWTGLTSMAQVSSNIASLKSKYNKDIMVVETAYPFTNLNNDSYNNLISGNDTYSGYGVSQQEQTRFLKDLTQQIISGGGIGIMYWEPAWITTTMNDGWGIGSSWENCTLFDFQNNTLPAIDYMNQSYQF